MYVCVCDNYFVHIEIGVTVFPLATDSSDTELIELSSDENTPLGLQIRSSHHHPGVFVHHLVPGSRSEQCGLLQPGDRVLEANGNDLKFVTVDDAALIISVRALGQARARAPWGRWC